MSRSDSDEENLSTQSAQACEGPRFSRENVNAQRARGDKGATEQGANPTHALIVRGTERDGGSRFPRAARLRTSRQFRRVFAEAVRSSDAFFLVIGRQNQGDEGRLGLAISRKCAPRSVDRSRLKRLVRESFRANRDILPGVDVVVTCRRRALNSPNQPLAASLCEHWARIRSQLCRSC